MKRPVRCNMFPTNFTAMIRPATGNFVPSPITANASYPCIRNGTVSDSPGASTSGSFRTNREPLHMAV